MRALLTALFLLALATPMASAEEAFETNSDDHQHAEVSTDSELTLIEVVRRTAAREAGIDVVMARRDEADALERNASRLLAGAPALTANHVTDGGWSDDGYRQWGASLELPLWWPGQRSGRRASAAAARAAAGHAERAHLLEVAGWVRQAIAELALAEIRLALTEAEWNAEDRLAAKIERAVELEELATRDLLLAQSSSLDRRIRYLEALEEFRHSQSAYFLLTGLTSRPANWSETPAGSEVLDDHPQLLLAAEEVARAKGEWTQGDRDQWGHPILALGTQHERDSAAGADFNNRFVAGLRVPLGRRNDAGAEIAAARRKFAEARMRQKRLERELRARLAQAEHRSALAGERVATATEQASIAAEYLRLTGRGFEFGETDLGTLLRARTRATAAEQTRREAEILKQFGVAELNQALGVLP